MFELRSDKSQTKILGVRLSCTQVLSVVLGVFIVSCGDKKQEVDLSKFSGLYSDYFASCGECHRPDDVTYKDQVKNLDMSSESAAYASLTSTANIYRLSSLGCEPAKYVQSGSSSKSILYAIMDADTADAFASGACKPLKHTKEYGGVANNPTAEQKQKIKEWIDKGAPQG